MQKCGTVIGLFSGGGFIRCEEQTFQFYFGQRAMVELSGSTLCVTEDKAEGKLDQWIERGDRIIFTTKGQNRKTVHRWAPLPKDNTPTQVWQKRRKVGEGPRWRILLLFKEGKFNRKRHRCKQKQNGLWQEVKIAA